MATHRLDPLPQCELATWGDESADEASRLYPLSEQPPRHWRVRVPANGGNVVGVVDAMDLATSTPLPDSSLGGKLFVWSWGVVPVGVPQVSLLITGETSEVRFTWTKAQAGLWLLTCWREDNGAASIPIECVVE